MNGREEALSVGTDVEGFGRLRLEEDLRDTQLQPCLRGLDRDRYDVQLGRPVEDLSSVGVPIPAEGAALRDLPLSARTGEGGRIELVFARFVRHVEDPASVRREPSA